MSITINRQADRLPNDREWVALCGKAGVGKDTLATFLVADHGFTRIAFADPVREMALAIDPFLYNGHDESERLSHRVEHEGWDQAKRTDPEVRRILQRIGTEAVRTLDPTFWVRVADERARAVDGPVVFTDSRFPNERSHIEAWGGIIVEIEGVTDLSTDESAHASEQGAQNVNPHITVHNPPAPTAVYRHRLRTAAAVVATYLEGNTP